MTFMIHAFAQAVWSEPVAVAPCQLVRGSHAFVQAMNLDVRITVSMESSPPPPVTAASSSREATDPALVNVGSSQRRELCMPKLPHRLRQVNAEAYEPNVVSIGPYHRGKQHLAAMEVIKQRMFRQTAGETGKGLNEFRAALSYLENEARKCYEVPLPLPRYLEGAQFLDMMVYDGCFVVHLIRKGFGQGIFDAERIRIDIRYDLMLFENQLPFFVLLKLFETIAPNDGGIEAFGKLALSFFDISHHALQTNDIIHLHGLVHSTHLPSAVERTRHLNYRRRRDYSPPDSERKWKFIGSATELDAAGISFFGDTVENMQEKDQEIEGMFDIKFTKRNRLGICGTRDTVFPTHTELKIPTLKVDDFTERQLRNYMAYEQIFPSTKPTYFVDYVNFMDSLINIDKDVQLLCSKGIIDNRLGDYEAVAKMFNKLGESIYMSEDFYYSKISDRVNKHCQIKCYKWKALLKKNYFHSPWSFISFMTASVLLLLTIAQIVFAILSYIKRMA